MGSLTGFSIPYYLLFYRWHRSGLAWIEAIGAVFRVYDGSRWFMCTVDMVETPPCGTPFERRYHWLVRLGSLTALDFDPPVKPWRVADEMVDSDIDGQRNPESVMEFSNIETRRSALLLRIRRLQLERSP